MKKRIRFLDGKGEGWPKLVHVSNQLDDYHYLQCNGENKVFKNQEKRENIDIFCKGTEWYFKYLYVTDDNCGNRFYNFKTVRLQKSRIYVFECEGNPLYVN